MPLTATQKSYDGGCHCGRVRMRVRGELARVLECNCSICTKKGILHWIVPRQDFELLSGRDALASYRFNTGVAEHTFCSNCGMHPFYVPRSHPDAIDVNVRCLEGVDLSALERVPFDGQNWERARAELAADAELEYRLLPGAAAAERVEQSAWGSMTWLADHAAGARALSLARLSVEAGARGVRHWHANCEEVLHVLSGVLRVEFDQRTLELAAGDTLIVAAHVAHALSNPGADVAHAVVAYSSAARAFASAPPDADGG